MLHPELNPFQFAQPRNVAVNQTGHLHANSISEIYVANVVVMALVTVGDVRHWCTRSIKILKMNNFKNTYIFNCIFGVISVFL